MRKPIMQDVREIRVDGSSRQVPGGLQRIGTAPETLPSGLKDVARYIRAVAVNAAQKAGVPAEGVRQEIDEINPQDIIDSYTGTFYGATGVRTWFDTDTHRHYFYVVWND